MMDYDDLTNVDFTDLFLNQQPTDSPPFSAASLDESEETAHERVEERIRELQGVKVRAGQGQRQSQRRERNSAECSHDQGDFLGNKDVEGGVDDVGTVDTNGEKGRGCKRDSSHLVGKALAMAMDSPSKKWGKEGSEGAGIWYDCNICLDLAKDPVLTCCGHLFCWACFYQLGYIDSTSKECPVCKGVVSNGNVIPVYGNGGSEGECECETESGLKVPPRPKARRVESVRMPPGWCVCSDVFV